MPWNNTDRSWSGKSNWPAATIQQVEVVNGINDPLGPSSRNDAKEGTERLPLFEINRMPPLNERLQGSRVVSTDEIRAAFPALERRHEWFPVAYFDGPGGTQVPLLRANRCGAPRPGARRAGPPGLCLLHVRSRGGPSCREPACD